ncbi:MAG: DVU_1553 family AMP-dependent CoA ligase [Bacillota bacterium]|jgi:phenylacetate-CoA ligase
MIEKLHPKFSPIEILTAKKCGVNRITEFATLEKFQIQLLKQQLNYAKSHSPFFAEHLKQVDIKYINCYQDLKQIPLMSAEQIYQNGTAMACLPLNLIPRFTTIRSSGTQGPVKQLYFTDNDIKKTAEFFTYGVQSMTHNVKKAVICLPGPAIGSIAQVLSRGLNVLGIQTYTFGAIKNYEAAAAVCLDFQADCVIGLPSQILQLAKTYPELKPQSVFLTADYIPDSLVKSIEEIWQCEVLSHYGLSECGLGGGVECPAHNGYHMRHHDLLYEIINPDTGEILPYGEFGEVVFSTLNREAMPLFRYRTGDIACLNADKCQCGAILPRLSKIKGRLKNFIVLENEKLNIQQLDEIILALPKVLDYQPKIENNTLKLYIKAYPQDMPGIEKKIKDILPNLKIEVYQGDGFYTRGTIKRNIEIILPENN